jgi:quercetin dioxygenase-like cupin family protein
MNRVLAGFLLALGATAANAATDFKEYEKPVDKAVLHGKDVPRVEVYMWVENGVTKNAFPGDGVALPPDAALLRIRNFAFTDGVVRELFYPKGIHTAQHLTIEDLSQYVVSGKLTAVINGVGRTVRAGDADFLGPGWNHGTIGLEESTHVSFVFPAKIPETPEPPVWYAGQDVPLVPVAAWVRDGKGMTAMGADAAQAPADAIRYTAKIFRFPRYSLIEAHFPKGTASQPRIDAEDGLIYVVKGRLRVHIGETDDVVGPGDVLHEVAGTPHRFEALENTVIVKVAAPPAVSPPR